MSSGDAVRFLLLEYRILTLLAPTGSDSVDTCVTPRFPTRLARWESKGSARPNAPAPLETNGVTWVSPERKQISEVML